MLLALTVLFKVLIELLKPALETVTGRAIVTILARRAIPSVPLPSLLRVQRRLAVHTCCPSILLTVKQTSRHLGPS